MPVFGCGDLPDLTSPLPDDPEGVEALRARLLEQVETETDAAALLAAELVLVSLREPLEPGPMAALLHHLAAQWEAALLRQDDEMNELRRRLRDRDEELGRRRQGEDA